MCMWCEALLQAFSYRRYAYVVHGLVGVCCELALFLHTAAFA
jgi:hypothetical protein